MPRAYSMDLRERVIAACEQGARSRAEIAEQYQISEATLFDWLRRWRAARSVAPTARAGGRVSKVDFALLEALVKEQSDRTLLEYADLYAERSGHRYCPSHLSRMLKRLNYSRKERRYAPRSSTSSRSLSSV